MSPGRKRNRRGCSRGQALAEFALVAPVFFLLLFGIIEAGRFIFHYHALNSAVREGARYAIVHGSNARDGCPSGPPAPSTPSCDPSGEKVRQAVVKAAFNLMTVSDINFVDSDGNTTPTYSADPNGGTNKRGTTVTVSATYTYPPIVPVMPPITIRSESSLVINN